jgi:2-polyprenyl-6-methoxyphenol hydroxylase-like FAD-dependent oxidoreductase
LPFKARKSPGSLAAIARPRQTRHDRPIGREGMMQSISTRCCIVGGGPAGMMAGYLLARAGIDVVVLEKHADFLRDFRGDTVHPSTMTVLDELGLLGRFLERPHQRLAKLSGTINGQNYKLADLSGLKVPAPFIALMPQWEFLNFLAEEARGLPSFHLRMSTKGERLLLENGVVTGVTANSPDGPLEIRARLVIAADGRHSVLRQEAGLPLKTLSAPIDVLWFRIGKDPTAVEQVLGHIERGRFMVTIDRGDYWQCAYVIPKGGADAIKVGSLVAFKEKVLAVTPGLAPHIDDIAAWDDVKLLSVAVDRLEHWSRAGLLCIGDAAHAMSPIAGVGINMAVQDAVAAANLLTPVLGRDAPVPDSVLDRLRRRRLLPTRVTQAFQVAVQNRVLIPTLAGVPLKIPFIIRLLDRFPQLRGLAAQFLGIGIRPEHVKR